jgi:small subunit ribosomal protein S17
MSEEVKNETTGARGHRKTRRGTVVKKSGDKTVSVLVERRYAHPIYGKQVTVGKKYPTHDEKNECGIGDVVLIEETRPLSARKRWRVAKIVVSAKAREAAAEAKAEAIEAKEEGK